MHPDAKTTRVSVNYRGDAPPAEAQAEQIATAHTTRPAETSCRRPGGPVQCDGTVRSQRRRARDSTRRTDRVHANASRGSARDQPHNLQPPRPTLPRHDRNRLRHTPDPHRRTPPIHQRTTKATHKSRRRPSAARPAGHAPPPTRQRNASSARRRAKPRADRARPERRRHTHSARRRPMVALHRPRRPRPPHDITQATRAAGTLRREDARAAQAPHLR